MTEGGITCPACGGACGDTFVYEGVVMWETCPVCHGEGFLFWDAPDDEYPDLGDPGPDEDENDPAYDESQEWTFVRDGRL